MKKIILVIVYICLTFSFSFAEIIAESDINKETYILDGNRLVELENKIEELEQKIQIIQNDNESYKVRIEEYKVSFNLINGIVSIFDDFLAIIITLLVAGIPLIVFIINRVHLKSAFKKIEDNETVFFESLKKSKDEINGIIEKTKESNEENEEKYYHKQRVLSYVEKNQSFRVYSEALNFIDKFSITGDEKYEFIVLMSRKLMENEQFVLALEIMEKTLLHDNSRADAIVNMGNCYRAMGQYEMAIERYEKAIEIDKKIYSAYLNMANTYLEMSSDNSAIECKKKAVEVIESFNFNEKMNGYIYYARSNVYLNAKEFKLALSEIEKAFSEDCSIGKDQIYYQKSKILYEFVDENDKKVKLEKAKTNIDIALSINNKNYLYHNTKGLILLELNELKNAIEAFEEALKIKEIDPKASDNKSEYYNLACCYSKLNKSERALFYLKKAVFNNFSDLEHLKNDKDLENLRIERCMFKRYGFEEFTEEYFYKNT